MGKKRVTLYAPSATDSLYPHEGMLLSNTAQVDPEAPDYKVFPAYRNTQAFLCLLSPGKLLGFKCIVKEKYELLGWLSWCTGGTQDWEYQNLHPPSPFAEMVRGVLGQ